ncbi:transporter [Ganoderma sinense ZZ0214-1]|uniref:ferric-chelate reductase (NADPH) n=1 Tax=Ganoderma sinense ZZ0214-1 TaxID=1077348 RepID=A0A2G8RZU7_9APHY|nr:transporter [Ganoderma sinense ZZ0214-1]
MSSSAHAPSPSAAPASASPSGPPAQNATAGGPPPSPGGAGMSMSPDRAIYFARDEAYPEQLWWLVAAFIGLVAVCQLASWALAKWSLARRLSRKKTTTGDAVENGGSPGAAGRGFALRNVPTALVNAYRVVAFRWTLEIGQSYTLNVAEVFVTVAYIVALFCWEFLGTTNLEGQKLDIKYWGTRAGILAVSQTPIVTALGTKNNVVAYITGISYDKLNYIHRMTARVIFVLLWVHGASKLKFADEGTWEEWSARVALTALIAFSALILVSIRPVRSQAYEIFYFVHFFMVLIFLLGGYYHANNYRYGTYVWPSLLIWALDRAIRLARVVYYNHLYFGFSKKAGRLDASVELLSPHFVRLHIQRPPHFSWTPGQTAFLTVPGVSGNPLECHPFTIASVDSHYQLAASASSTSKNEKKAATSVAVSPARPGDDDASPYWKELTFLINVRSGFTRRLAARASAQAPAPVGAKVAVLVDGPYGFSPNLDNDDTVVLVAGGSGVTFTLATFLGVLSCVQSGRSACRRLVWIWSIREPGHIEWVSKALTRALSRAPPELEISIRIYVTGKGAGASGKEGAREGGAGERGELGPEWKDDDSVHSSSEGTAVGRSRPPSLLSFDAVQVCEGRPELHELLREEVEATSGRISVTVCGSQGIARACRKALRVPLSMSLRGGPSVVLHVESFGYA